MFHCGRRAQGRGVERKCKLTHFCLRLQTKSYFCHLGRRSGCLEWVVSNIFMREKHGSCRFSCRLSRRATSGPRFTRASRNNTQARGLRNVSFLTSVPQQSRRPFPTAITAASGLPGISQMLHFLVCQGPSPSLQPKPVGFEPNPKRPPKRKPRGNRPQLRFSGSRRDESIGSEKWHTQTHSKRKVKLRSFLLRCSYQSRGKIHGATESAVSQLSGASSSFARPRVGGSETNKDRVAPTATLPQPARREAIDLSKIPKHIRERATLTRLSKRPRSKNTQ